MKKRWMALVSLMVLAVAVSGAAEKKDLELLQDKTIEMPAGGRFHLDTEVGSVRIKKSADNKVMVKVWGNKKAAEKLTFTFDQKGDSLLVKAVKKDSKRGFDFKPTNVEYEITVPQMALVWIETGGGGIEAADLAGKIMLETSGGSIDMKHLKGPIQAGTSGGSISCADCEGDIDVETSGGSIELESRNGVVKASTSGGSIELTYSGQNQGIDLETSAGSIELILPTDIKADLNLETSVGKINCDFKITEKDKVTNAVSSSLEGKINGGGKLIQCQTSAGGIEISKLKI